MIEGFCRNAVRSGIDIMRIFDALNDIDNMKSTIRYVKQNGGIADCAVCYTVDPKFTLARPGQGVPARPSRCPGRIFSVDYFVTKAEQLAGLGADMITIKDMAGLIDPRHVGQADPLPEKERGHPHQPAHPLHAGLRPGLGADGHAQRRGHRRHRHPEFLGRTGRAGLRAGPAVRRQARAGNRRRPRRPSRPSTRPCWTSAASWPSSTSTRCSRWPFDIAADKLPAEIDALFDRAIAAARAERIAELLQNTQAIEKYFNFPAPDDIVRVAQIPGGMYTNMLAQLQQAKLEHLKDKVLQTVPRVRLDAGVPPLVTPTSQIVGVQAVNCVIDEANGKPFYTSKSTQFVNLVKGTYGKTPFPVDPAFRLKIAGTREETPYDTSKYQKQENPLLREFGDVPPGPRRKRGAAARAVPQRGQHLPEEAAREGISDHPEKNPKAEENSAADKMWESLSDYA